MALGDTVAVVSRSLDSVRHSTLCVQVVDAVAVAEDVSVNEVNR